MRPFCACFCASLLCMAAAAAQAEVRRIGDVVVRHGMCDASAAVAVPESGSDAFVVANDEDDRIRAYAWNPDAAPRPLRGGDLGGFLRVGDSKREADIEGAAWLGGRIYWIGSHGRNSEGKPRPERRALFATAARRNAGGEVVLEPVGAPRDLRRALSRPRLGLADALGGDGTDQSLAPERRGLNIEGLAARPDGASLLVGLRNPLRDGKAVLVALENPAAAVDGREEPRLGDEPFLLDLGGRGVRSIEYLAARSAYLIAAGPVADPAEGDRSGFDLFSWTGRREDPAIPLAEDLADAGLDVAEAPSAEAALRVASAAEAAGPAPWVLATDVDLGGGMDGLALAAEVRRRWPGVGLVVMTGRPSNLDGRGHGPREVRLLKPFAPRLLAAAVNGLLGRSSR